LVFLRSVRRLLVAASVVPSSPIFGHPDEGGPSSSETLVLTRATRRNNPEDTILDSLCNIFHTSCSFAKEHYHYAVYEILFLVKLCQYKRLLRSSY
jgi:hypothetical protein